MEQNKIQGKTVEQWRKEKPVIEQMMNYQQVFWINDRLMHDNAKMYQTLELSKEDVMEAEGRWRRFAPLLMKLFPETKEQQGVIESELIELHKMKKALRELYQIEPKGRLFLKGDNALPIAGSIKARGGIYEVLKYAESLAATNGLLQPGQDYSILAEKAARELFSGYSLSVGSTGNLGLSIGIMGAAIGFQVTVHMSADAKQWKKDLLRSKGVTVIEYASDYGKAVEEGRKLAMQDPKCHFVDDEHSKDLFLGYSVAALRLKDQLQELRIHVDKEHPLFVYLPCGVGGAPGGICFGLKLLFGDAVHCFFVEPTHSPCMLLGLATGENDKVSVQDFGLDNKTEGDGLAVGRASGFVGRVIEHILSGVYTISDNELYKLLALLQDEEEIQIEPSAAASLNGSVMLLASREAQEYLKEQRLEQYMDNAVHISWATGGSFVPVEMKKAFYEKGKMLLKRQTLE